MLTKLIWKGTGKFQLIGASLGATIGFVLLLFSFQFYFDISEVFNSNKDLISEDYIIINKKLSAFKSLNVSKSTFTKKEIQEIEESIFISDVSPFISNNFRVSAYTNKGEKIPYFRTELFFEAIPNEYVDLYEEQWKWELKDSLIPIIIPKDYLNLYNFGFAKSQGLPQISGSLINLVSFNVKIRGNGKTEVFRGKIVGFSSRINSILVPYNFLNWANQKFSTVETLPSRLVILTETKDNVKLLQFLEDNNYETNNDKLKSSKLNAILQAILAVTSSIAFIIIFLSVLIFIVAFQLIISKSSTKLQILIKIGYHYKKLSKIFISNFLIIILFINIFAFFIIKIIRNSLLELLYDYGFEVVSGISTYVILGGILLSLIIILLNSISIIQQIKKY